MSRYICIGSEGFKYPFPCVGTCSLPRRGRQSKHKIGFTHSRPASEGWSNSSYCVELSLYPYHLGFTTPGWIKLRKLLLLALTHQYTEEDQQVLIIPEWWLLGGYILWLLCGHWQQRRSIFMSWDRRGEVRDHPRSLGLALRQPLMTSRKNVGESKGNWSSCSASSIFSAVDFVCFNFTL